MVIRVLILIILFGLLGISIYLLYENLPIFHEINTLAQDYFPSDIPIEVRNAVTPQFYPNMRFNHLPITYYLDPRCDQERADNMKMATGQLAEAGVTFDRVISEDADITVGCSEKYYKEEGIFIAGHGGPSLIINSTPWSVIQKGVIKLFSKSCDANIELHELLHVLGFDHSPNPESIMYNLSSCNQEITPDIIETLRALYTQEPLADLYFKNISATKQGRYLTINFGVFNRGLVDAPRNVDVALYTDDVLVRTFTIRREIAIGAGSHLSIENLRLPKLNVKKILLKIDPGNKISEINKEDNDALLSAI